MKKIVQLLLLALLVGSLYSCGYSFRHQQSNLPPDIKTIAIPMFENKTNEVGFEGIITEQMRYQFSNSQILKLASKAEADVVMIGAITYIYSDDVTLTTRTTSQLRRARIAISVRVVRSDNGKVIYNGSASQNRSYVISPTDNATTEMARTEAIRLAARDMAQTVHDGILQNF